MSVSHCLGFKMSCSVSCMLGRHSRQGALQTALVLEVCFGNMVPYEISCCCWNFYVPSKSI